MGMSAYAHIGFGIKVPIYGDEIPGTYEQERNIPELVTESGLDAYLAERAGLVDPYKDLPEEINYGTDEQFREWKESNPGFEERTDAWFEAKRKLEADAPIEIYVPGDYDWAEDVVIVLKDTYESVYWGDVETLPMSKLVNVTGDGDRIRAAKKFCEEIDFPPFVGTQWLLWATYG